MRTSSRAIMAVVGAVLLIFSVVQIIVLSERHYSFTPAFWFVYGALGLICILLIVTAARPSKNIVHVGFAIIVGMGVLLFVFNPALAFALFIAKPLNAIIILIALAVYVYKFFLYKPKNDLPGPTVTSNTTGVTPVDNAQ